MQRPTNVGDLIEVAARLRADPSQISADGLPTIAEELLKLCGYRLGASSAAQYEAPGPGIVNVQASCQALRRVLDALEHGSSLSADRGSLLLPGAADLGEVEAIDDLKTFRTETKDSCEVCRCRRAPPGGATLDLAASRPPRSGFQRPGAALLDQDGGEEGLRSAPATRSLALRRLVTAAVLTLLEDGEDQEAACHIAASRPVAEETNEIEEAAEEPWACVLHQPSQQDAPRTAVKTSDAVLKQMESLKRHEDEATPTSVHFLSPIGVCARKTARLLAVVLCNSMVIAAFSMGLLWSLRALINGTVVPVAQVDDEMICSAAVMCNSLFLGISALTLAHFVGERVIDISWTSQSLRLSRLYVLLCLAAVPGFILVTLYIVDFEYGVRLLCTLGRRSCISSMVLLSVNAYIAFALMHRESRQNLALQAAVTAARIAKGAEPSAASYRRPIWKAAIMSAMPFLVVLGAAMAYFTIILFLVGVSNSTLWRLLVYGITLLFKIVGNKTLLRMLTLNTKISYRTLELVSWWYELGSCLFCRLALLSIEDQAVLATMSLFSLVIEVLVRAWYTGQFVSRGHAIDPDTESLAWQKWWRAGRARSIDNFVDMQVEYAAPLMCMATIYVMQPVPAFDLGRSQPLTHGEMVQLLIVQLLPELVVDIVLTMSEMRNGLQDFYDAYLSKPWTYFTISELGKLGCGLTYIPLFLILALV